MRNILLLLLVCVFIIGRPAYSKTTSQCSPVSGETENPASAYVLQGDARYVGGFATEPGFLPAVQNKELRGELLVCSRSLQFIYNGSQRLIIPIRHMVTLARGMPPSGGAKASEIVTIGTSLASLLFGQLKSSVQSKSASGSTTTSVTPTWRTLMLASAGAAVVSGIVWYRRSHHNNYIAIAFSDTDNDGKVSLGCQTTRVEKDPPLFNKGRLAMFKLTSQRDYWNISMILNSATGCEFISEQAEKK